VPLLRRWRRLITIGSAFLVARGVLGFLAQGGWQLSSVLDSFIVVLVFGVGTDYTIFLISRFREELGRHDHDEALRVTVSRISAVITASAATVVVGLASMVVARFGMIQTTGPALAITIVVTLLAGLTLTPSLLAIFGRRALLAGPRSHSPVADEDRDSGRHLRGGSLPGPGCSLRSCLFCWRSLRSGCRSSRRTSTSSTSCRRRRVAGGCFETLSQHLAEGQLMPLTVLVKAPASPNAFTSQQGLADVGALEKSIAALPDIQSIRSVVESAR